MSNEVLEATLASYRAQIEQYEDYELEVLVEHYGLVGVDRPSRINALVEHFRKELSKR